MKSLFTILTFFFLVASNVAQPRKLSAIGEIGPAVVWAYDPPEGVLSKMKDDCPRMTNSDYLECRARILQEAGSSSHVLTIFKRLDGEGWIFSFKDFGRIDLAEAVFPFMANANDRYLLVNGSPQIVDVERSLNRNNQMMRNDPLYPFFRRQFPELRVGGYPEFEQTRTLPSGQRFIFKFQLVNGCRACWANGYAHMAYDFDRAGRFKGTKLLRLSKAAGETK